MNNLSLTQSELQRLLKVYFSLVLTIALCLYFVLTFFGYEPLTSVWRAISYGLTCITFFFGVFLSWPGDLLGLRDGCAGR